ncbi:T-box transcription factor tbx5 [Chytridiales sp. JEL 0842]|nr:T-box transcription factor tbx5 [Chytridiales sp. JEL 0842]
MMRASVTDISKVELGTRTFPTETWAHHSTSKTSYELSQQESLIANVFNSHRQARTSSSPASSPATRLSDSSQESEVVSSPAIMTSENVETDIASSSSASSSFGQGQKLAPPVYVVLHEAWLWTQFHNEQNEMIVTKNGRCLFPTLSVKATNQMESRRHYSIGIDVVPTMSSRLRFKDQKWRPVSNRFPGMRDDDDIPINQSTGKLYVHPMSPMSGADWKAQGVIDFRGARLTNRKDESDDNIDELPLGFFKLASFHQYAIRLVVIIHKPTTTNSTVGPAPESAWIYELDETRFVAVTHYQNEKINTLKKNYNPHAKGFKDGQTEVELARLVQQQNKGGKVGKVGAGKVGYPSKAFMIGSGEVERMVGHGEGGQQVVSLKRKHSGASSNVSKKVSGKRRGQAGAKAGRASARYRPADTDSEEEADSWDNSTNSEEEEDESESADSSEFAYQPESLPSSRTPHRRHRVDMLSAYASPMVPPTPHLQGSQALDLSYVHPSESATFSRHLPTPQISSAYMLRPRNRAVSLCTDSSNISQDPTEGGNHSFYWDYTAHPTPPPISKIISTPSKPTSLAFISPASTPVTSPHRLPAGMNPPMGTFYASERLPGVESLMKNGKGALGVYEVPEEKKVTSTLDVLASLCVSILSNEK